MQQPDWTIRHNFFAHLNIAQCVISVNIHTHTLPQGRLWFGPPLLLEVLFLALEALQSS